MAVFKCKMCGGSMQIADQTYGQCPYCGTAQTFPKLDDERRNQIYDRANQFRRNNEFDKASGLYEAIVNEQPTDPEAYWSLVLCRYGIAYVEDPITHKRMPTINRVQYKSILMDEDYKKALENADGIQKQIYESEATLIDNIQKNILDISSKEEPFDIFICYKETDNAGLRTNDSVYAEEIYNALTKEGYKVFFARITLEDKLGSAYEPYIFAALNSAKVMLCVGTSKDNLNAIWVKNEWSRFLGMISRGDEKVLIPVYKEMDPYDLPDEFAYLQSQDMSKVGFIQDLIRGINKITGKNNQEKTTTVKETVVVNAGNADITPLLKRAYMFLEDKDWNSANEYCEKVLDIDPENAEAYLGKLLVEQKVSTKEQLKDVAEPFDDSNNYQKTIRFANEQLGLELRGYIEYINERNENTRLTSIYEEAKNAMYTANTEDKLKGIAYVFNGISNFKDSKELAKECLEKAEEARLEAERKKEAAKLEAERKAEEKRIATKKAAKKRKKIISIVVPIVCICIVFLILLNSVIIPSQKYNKAMEYINNGEYESAISILSNLSYKDSEEKLSETTVKYYKKIFAKAEVGSAVYFGTYEQDNDTSNGKEDIEWRVLAKEGNKILVVSEYALDCQEYNTSYTDVTWETCSLRKWMNGTFLNDAFTEEEQAMIQTTNVSADSNPVYGTDPGNDTKDKVFLLSINEVVEKYFSSDEDRKCVPTAYAIAQGAYTSDSYTKGGKATCWLWLRSRSPDQHRAAQVYYDGYVYYDGGGADIGYGCVRPALWINFES